MSWPVTNPEEAPWTLDTVGDTAMPTEAAGITADDRARAFEWLQENAELFLDFDVLAEREQFGL